jgi:biotin-(acetyl-CoA carboxylase) ligase
MIVLADCPESLAGLAPGATGSEVRVDSLPASDRALWRALGEGDRLWSGTGAEPGPPGYWSRALIVAEARASQFDALGALLAAGPGLPGPTACAALSGRGFHGLRGRPWLSAPGNLHLCAVFPEPGLPARDAGSLTMLPAVALVEAIRATSGGRLRPGIKWVNDVLLDGRKVGGVLTATQTQGGIVRSVLFGVGLNVSTTPRVPPTPFVPSAGSLAEAGASVTWADACTGVLAALGRWMTRVATAGPGALLEAYRGASLVVGREVCVFEDSEDTPAEAGRPPSPLHRGTVRGIAADLALIVEGVETPVARGRLAFAEDCRRFWP